MQISQFDLFCQIARVKSFSKAAKLLHISQPAISAQVHSMEEFYGIKLFERTPHGVTLTPAGNVLFATSKKILEMHDQLERSLTNMADEKNKKLVVGATPTVGNHALACGIWTFRDRYPEVKIHLEISNCQDILNKLASKAVDVAILECPVIEARGLSLKPVFRDHLVAIVPHTEKWEQKESVTLEELCAEGLILREEGSELQYLLDYALEPLGKKFSDLQAKAYISSSTAIKTAVEKGHGVSICLTLTMQKELRNGIFLSLPIEGIRQDVEYQLAYRTSDVTGSAKRFIRFIATPGELEVC